MAAAALELRAVPESRDRGAVEAAKRAGLAAAAEERRSGVVWWLKLCAREDWRKAAAGTIAIRKK